MTAAMAGILSLTLCTGAVAQEVIKVGGIGSLSGGGTAWGVATQRGVQLAIDEVNKDGGLKVGGKVYKPQLVMVDDAYSATGGRTAAERLVNAEQVKYILGPIGSPSVLGALPITTKAQVLVLSNGFAKNILQNPWNSAYNFRVSLSTIEFAPAMVKWLREQRPNLKKVALIYPNDATGQAVIPILTAVYKQYGFEVWSEGYERGSKEFTPLLTRMMAQGVDVMDVNSNAPGEAGLMVRQARQAGFDKLIWQVGGPSVDEIINVAGQYAEGFMSYNVVDDSDERFKKFFASYREKYRDTVVNAYTPTFYNATKLLFKSLQDAGTVSDVTKVRDTLQKLNGYDAGIYGPVAWGGKADYGVEHQLLTKFWITEVKNGKPVTKATLTPEKR